MFAILAIFALAGPAVGAVAVALCLSLLSAVPLMVDESWAEAARILLGGTALLIVFGLPVAYVIGTVSALAVGLVVALWDRRYAALSWRVALVAALLPWLLAATRAGDMIAGDEATRTWQVSLLAAHLCAALASWALARAILGSTPR